MKTCGMMGEVVGKAASLCAQHDCQPRDVYATHLEDLKDLLELPGQARRETVGSPIVMPENVPPRPGPHGPPTGIDPASLEGIVVDDRQARKTGRWTEGTGLKGYFGYGYLYTAADGGASIRFEFTPPKSGRYEVRLAYRSHENRGTRVPVAVHSADGSKITHINMRQPPPLANGLISLGVFSFTTGKPGAVEISAKQAGGNVHADAIQVLPAQTQEASGGK
jgi:hypothetical protein